MSLYGAFDTTKHFAELAEPLESAEGVLSPATRRARCRAALGLGEEELTTDVSDPAGDDFSGQTLNIEPAVALGNFANVLNGRIAFAATGRVTGLAAPICSEIDLSAGCTQGSYACFEAELIMPADALTGTRTSFLTMNLSGADASTFDANGFIFDLNGLTAGSAGDASAFSPVTAHDFVTATHRLKVQVGGTTYYVPLHTAPDLGGGDTA